MDEAGRLEIAGHVGRLGHELIRFAELARARLNAIQDYSDVPTLALQDDWPIYMAEEPRAGSLRLPRPNRGKRERLQRLPKVPSEDVEGALMNQEIPEPPSPEGMRLWKDPDPWTPDAGEHGVPSVRSLPSVPRSEEISAQSPDAEFGVPKSAPRRFLPTPSLRSQTEELPEPPECPDAELGVPKSAPRRFLPTPSLRSQTKELQAEVPEPGTPEPPWSPEERSPQLRRRLFEEEAPEPPLAPEVGHDTDALRFPAGLNDWHDRRSHANGTPAGAAEVANDSESFVSEVTGRQHGQYDKGRPAHGRLTRSKATHRPKRRVGSRYQAHVMNQAAAALGRLQEEVSALRQRMVAMEAPCAPMALERTTQHHLSESASFVGGSDELRPRPALRQALPEPPEAPQDEALEVDQKQLPVPRVVPVPDQGAPQVAARSRSPSLDSVDYWAELNQVDPGSAVTARKGPLQQGASLNASGASTGSVPETRAEPPKAAAKEVPTAVLPVEEAVEVKAPPLKQALSYWLQVDCIFGLEDSDSSIGEVTYEVQGYWLSHMTSVARLASAPKHNRSECRVRNQVVLPKGPNATKLAVEVVQKTPDVVYIGRVELDASETSVHQVNSYELLPSNARIRLRICPHRASISSARGAVVSQPQTPTPRGSLQSVASTKALPVEERTAGQSTATSAVTPATVRPAATSAAPSPAVAPAAAAVQAVVTEDEDETEEGEEEELTEDDPMVP